MKLLPNPRQEHEMRVPINAEIQQIAGPLPRHGVQGGLPAVQDAAELGQPQDLGREAHVGFRYANIFDSLCVAPQVSEEPGRLRQTHPKRSSCLALFSYHASGIDLRRNRFTFVQPLPQFCKRCSLRDFFNLP
jgi:hypothetical protein